MPLLRLPESEEGTADLYLNPPQTDLAAEFMELLRSDAMGVGATDVPRE